MRTLVGLAKDVRALSELTSANGLNLVTELRGAVGDQIRYLRDKLPAPRGLVTECPGYQVVGHCPACHKPVLDTDDPVWTCPANLSEGNPHRLAPMNRITDAMQQKAGCFSYCGTDFGLGCYEDMPLHGACYNSDGVTW